MLHASALRDGTLRDDYDACFTRVRDELYARIETQARRRRYDLVVMDYTSALCVTSSACRARTSNRPPSS